MKESAKYYTLYYLPMFFILRILIIFIFIIMSLGFLKSGLHPYKFISIASLLLVFEIFFYFKFAKGKPIKSLTLNNADPMDSYSLLAAQAMVSSKNSNETLKHLFKTEEIKFFLDKSGISEKEVAVIDMDLDNLQIKAKELALTQKKDFVQPSDIFASYLLLTENSSKLLLSKNLTERDVLNILTWASLVFPVKKEPEHMIGRGIADSWIFGWISETKKYMLDLTSEVISKKRYFYPREKEYNSMLSSIAAFKSIILVGNPGSGKDALLEQFAADSYSGKLGKELNYIKVFQLLVDQFLSGAKDQGEIEQRFTSIIEELSHAKDIVVFIENIENILGNPEFKLDLSSVLIPYIKESKIRIVGSTTPQSYKESIEKKEALVNTLSILNVAAPTEDENLLILLEKSLEIEKKYNVDIKYQAVAQALILGSKYLPTFSMPGSAVSLLDDTSSAQVFIRDRIIDGEDVDRKVQEKTKIPLTIPTAKEKETLLNLEDEIHKYIVDQNEAVTAISEAIRRVRSGIGNGDKPTSFLFLGPTGVGKTQTAKTVSNIYFGGEKEIIRLDMSEYTSQEASEKILKSASGGFLDQVFNNPYSLILLDEFEKADSKVQNLFLQALDDARLTDVSGRTVSFQNCLIIATSNAGSEFIRESISSQNSLPESFSKILIDYLLKQNIFKPELLNRFDSLVVFKPLSKLDIESVTKLVLTDLEKSLEKQEIFINFDQVLVSKVANEGFDRDFGARPLKRFVQDFIEDRLSRDILEGKIKKGDKINLSVDSTGNLLIGK